MADDQERDAPQDGNQLPLRPVESMDGGESGREEKRSAVRRRVTYAVIYAYLGLAAVVIVWLMWAERYEVAIGVLGGVAGLAGSVSGFWFGSRRPGPPPPSGS